MENEFESLISDFIENKIGISEDFVSSKLATNLKNNLIALDDRNMLSSAGTGNSEHSFQNKKVRGDGIYWLDRKHEDQYENEFFNQIDDFVEYLNRTCYSGITGYEFHYSLYEKGSFYKKHVDQFNNNSSRQFSMISYLNADWKEEDGGELLIHQQENNQLISPTNGKTVFFRSNELEHEVLVTNEKRMSITGWLKRD